MGVDFNRRCSPHVGFEITNPHIWNYNNVELNPKCYFKYDKRRSRENLTNWKLLCSLTEEQFCSCWEFAWIISNPNYDNLEVSEEDFTYMAVNSGAFRFNYNSRIKYALDNPSIHYQDPYVKEILMKFYPSIYKELKIYTKTPKPGRMFYSLLKYCLPKIRRSKDWAFNVAYESVLDEIKNKFEFCDPLSINEAIHLMPKNTSGGFTSLAKTGKRLTKGEIIPEIVSQYHSNRSNNFMDFRPNMLAMRGHFSKRTKIKTRYIWIVPPETILSEIRFAEPFYKQIRTVPFFWNKILTGKGTLPRLNKLMNSNRGFRFINTDISGWDAMGSTFVQRDLFEIYRSKLNLTFEDQKEFEYVIKNNIETTLLLPHGQVLQKFGGVSTGTYYTLLNNSILNMIYTRTVLHMMDILEICEPQIWLGDDFAFFPLPDFKLEVFSNLMSKYFGLKVHPDKCIDTYDMDERKFIGYQIKNGEMWRDEIEFFAGALYNERFFDQKKMGIEISLGKIFSFMLIGGVNNVNYYNFFFCFVGYYKTLLSKVEFEWKEHLLPGMLRVLKVAYAIELPALNLDSFRNFNWYGLKNFLLYDGDIKLLT